MLMSYLKSLRFLSVVEKHKACFPEVFVSFQYFQKVKHSRFLALSFVNFILSFNY